MTVEESYKQACEMLHRIGCANAHIDSIRETARELREEAEEHAAWAWVTEAHKQLLTRIAALESRAVLRPEGMPGEAVPCEWKIPGKGHIVELIADCGWRVIPDSTAIGGEDESDHDSLPEALAALGVE